MNQVLPSPDCLGIPVRYDHELRSTSVTLKAKRWWCPWSFTETPGLCETQGLFDKAHIVVGPVFTRIAPREQMAILLHEAGHVKLRHNRARILNAWKILLRPAAFANLCIEQEFEADRFAAGCGYGADLVRFFGRLQETHAALHPPLALRIERLTHS